MEMKTTLLKRCVLLAVKGRVDSSTAPKFQDEIAKVIEEGNFKIVIDMKEMDFISSAGLWVMVDAQKKCKRFNRGEVVLSSVPARVHHALDLAGFIPYFRTYEDSAQAVGSF
jgi:anti-sigma B factor antagonist